MKELEDFLNSKDLTKNKLFKSLECSKEEGKILLYLCRSYFSGQASINTHLLLSSLYKDFSYLSKLDLVESLIDKDLISAIRPKEKLALIQTEISPSSSLLLLLEKKAIKIKFEKKPFYDFNSYLAMQFARLELVQRLSNLRDKTNIKKIKNLIEKIDINIRQRLGKGSNVLEDLFKEAELDINEKMIFLALLKQEYSLEEAGLNAKSLLSLCEGAKNPAYLKESSKLLSLNLVEYEEFFGSEFYKSYFLSQSVIEKVLNPQKKLTNKLQSLVKELDIFELIEPKVDFEDIIMSNTTRALLADIIKQQDKKVVSRLAKWGIKNSKDIEAKIIFYGSAGTGKTMSALAMAKAMKKPLLNFDCSKILSKYVGESEQNVRRVFDEYIRIKELSKQAPILLLNEADQFLSTRSTGVAGSEKMHNQMQNIFLEQIEKFSGVLIATTNFLESLDTAFSRRFEYKIEFKRPNIAQRMLLWEKYLPKNAPYSKDFSLDKLTHFSLSGAQIKLVIKNTALNIASQKNPLFTNESFIIHIKKEINSSFDREKTMGFFSF